MVAGRLRIELKHEPRLCYAMQQNAVPWLRELSVRNDSVDAIHQLTIRVELVGFSEPADITLEALQPGESANLPPPDLVLRGEAFAALDERVRTELRVEAFAGGVVADWAGALAEATVDAPMETSAVETSAMDEHAREEVAAEDSAPITSDPEPPDAESSGEAAEIEAPATEDDESPSVPEAPEPIQVTTRGVDVLAYNEWPGYHALPALLATFVLPNHPALTPLLHVAGERLQRQTGNGGLDGYQSGDPDRVRAMFASCYDAVVSLGVRYVSVPPSFEQVGQKVRLPEQIVGDRLGTCLDLSLLFAALLEHCGLCPFLVVLREHAMVGVWLSADSATEPTFGSAVELRKGIAAGTLQVCEATVACVQPPQPHERALDAGRQRLSADEDFLLSVDVAAARRAGFLPLPMRSSGFVATETTPTETRPRVPREASESAPVTSFAASSAGPSSTADAAVSMPATVASGPRDRLEHWQQKLLDLSMFNRLLNFVETKKTVPLCAHDIGALEDRMQSGSRFRIYARPELQSVDGAQRDLELHEQRSGQDVVAEYLSEELRRGRLRADLDDELLDVRLTEIFRHARTSLEESGANTLYLAIGFLRWFESEQSSKPRRAPLLLLPVVVERMSVQEGYRFVMDDAEVRVNTTLLQMLSHDFDVRVAIGDQLPEDERGVDVDAVLQAFREATLPLARWEVESCAHLGFFSFTKYLMWRDLQQREALLQSPVLRHLVESPGSALEQDVPEVPRDELDDLDPADVFCPKDADSSQLAAVIAGAAGRSFVLEGPPGTGKSQTITNLIAQGLASGKRVLFVAEKRAALEVVHRRLTDVGMSAFCLELHSQKSGPKAVLEQLRQTLELGQRRSPREWQQVAEDLQNERSELNAFVLSLHRRREHGWSVHQAMAALIDLRDVERVELPELLEASAAEMEGAREALEHFVVASGPIGVPSESPWWGVQITAWTPAVTRDLTPLLDRQQRAAGAVREALVPVVEALQLTEPFGDGPTRRQYLELLQLLQCLRSPKGPPSHWLRIANWRAFEEDLERACAIGQRRDALWHGLAARWRRDLLDLDLGGLAATYRLHAESWFVWRWWRLRAARTTLASVATGLPGKATAVRDDLDAALRVRDEQRDLLACTVVQEVLGAGFRSGELDWQEHAHWLERVRTLRLHVLRLHPGALQPPEDVLSCVADWLDAQLQHAGGNLELGAACSALQAAHDEFAAANERVRDYLQLEESEAFGADDEPDHLGAVAAWADRGLREAATLRDHCAWLRAAQLAEERHLGPLVAQHARGSLALHQLSPVFDRSVYEGWLDRLHRQEPRLARFRGRDHEAAIQRFAELDQESIRLGARVVVARLAAGLPQLRGTSIASSELGVLERELKKQRRHKPVRRLLHEIRGLWPRLSPCVLMSPLSVAQYLGSEARRFDMVVFDEASQIPMWDAVGAIGRGDSLIVVGDSRQLPPTSFFQRVADEDGDDSEHDIPEDLESVLDECGAAGLPRMHLDWHYRSRHESLIAFSNERYYHNRLLTFPSPQQATDGYGVRLHRVDGVYDRAGSQQNRIEAEALVAEVVRRLRSPAAPVRSLGIVTFSRSQQGLIEDLLDAERRADPSLDAALMSSDEELFVKNLENVQGDERDVILFSICYGPDAAGKIYENYGPLNLQGGERRLNVAVTRARFELVVFASIGPEHVANRSRAVGARHLKLFLDYAQRGPVALAAASEGDAGGAVESPFEEGVRDALEARGYEIHTQVGCSGYRIDLAVVDAELPGRYLLGIECDGATYHRAATARDRDRLRASVLRGLGWQLVRVWSTDYWQDPDGEIDRLEAAIDEARAVWARRDLATSERSKAADEIANDATEEDPTSSALSPEVDDSPSNPAPSDDARLASGALSAAAPSEPMDGAEALQDSDHDEDVAHDPDGPRGYEVWQPAAELPEDTVSADELLTLEGPIAFARFARLLAGAWGSSRLTDRVRARVRAALPSDAVELDGLLWRDASQQEAFEGFRVPVDGRGVRDAADLPCREVAHAMRWLLRQHQAIAEDDLMREAARCFGLQRLGSVVRDVASRAVDIVLSEGWGRRIEDRIELA